MSTAIELPIVAAQPQAQPEEDICCICCDVETPDAVFVRPGPCKCKGSIKFHLPCLLQAMQHSEICGACKTPYSDPEFIGFQKRPLKPEEEALIASSNYFKNYANSVLEAIVYYKASADGVEQGEAYIFLRYAHATYYSKWNSTTFYYFATVSFTDGIIDGTVVVAADKVKTPSLSAHKGMQFTVIGGEVAGPFERYYYDPDAHVNEPNNGKIVERGTRLPSGKFTGKYEHYTWICDIYGNWQFALVERSTYNENGSGYADGEHMYQCQTNTSDVIFANYKDGLLHGKWALHPNRSEGSCAIESRNYKHGQLHGEFSRYDRRDGFLRDRRQYKDGLLHGKWAMYEYVNHNGQQWVQPVITGTFMNGMQVGIQRAFMSGALYEETRLAMDGSGLLDGVSTYYHKNGSIQQRSTYKMGVLHGPLRLYDERSVERIVIQMKDGMPKEGSWALYYDASGKLEEKCKVEYGTFLADLLPEEFSVRYHAAYSQMQNSIFTDVLVELREPEPEPEYDDYCGCAYCRTGRYDDDDNDDDDDDDDDYDRDYYRERYRRGYW